MFSLSRSNVFLLFWYSGNFQPSAILSFWILVVLGSNRHARRVGDSSLKPRPYTLFCLGGIFSERVGYKNTSNVCLYAFFLRFYESNKHSGGGGSKNLYPPPPQHSLVSDSGFVGNGFCLFQKKKLWFSFVSSPLIKRCSCRPHITFKVESLSKFSG